MGLDGRKGRSEQFIMNENGTLQRVEVPILERWSGRFSSLLTTTSPNLDPTISALFPQRLLAPSLGDKATIDGIDVAVIRGGLSSSRVAETPPFPIHPVLPQLS